MAVPTTLFNFCEVRWIIPATIVAGTYDTTNIYKSSSESQNYQLLASISNITATSYTDTTTSITAKDAANYMVLWSHSTTGIYSSSSLAYKAPTPREQRLILQLRDYLSRFITNRLADEELRQYLEFAVNAFNIYSPITNFGLSDLPKQMEPLLMTGAVILGVSYNMLGIGFTDIGYSDQGFQLTTSRYDKMAGAFDKMLSMYNNLLSIAKMEYAEGPEGVGTVALPIGMGGNIGRGVMGVFDLLGSLGR